MQLNIYFFNDVTNTEFLVLVFMCVCVWVRFGGGGFAFIYLFIPYRSSPGPLCFKANQEGLGKYCSHLEYTTCHWIILTTFSIQKLMFPLANLNNGILTAPHHWLTTISSFITIILIKVTSLRMHSVNISIQGAYRYPYFYEVIWHALTKIVWINCRWAMQTLTSV